MTALEDRLRSDLPTLAGALMADHEGERIPEEGIVAGSSQTGDDEPQFIGSTAPTSSRTALGLSRRRVAVAMVTGVGLLGVVLVGVVLVGHSSKVGKVSTDVSVADDVGEELVSSRSGTWTTMSEAPIEQRSLAAVAWTGTEAVFWAGSSLDRLFAYGDGAAYNPATDSWRNLAVPGWGHPGLSTTFFGGEFYAVAKGGVSTLDPSSGTWGDLSSPPGMFVGDMIATDGAVWGLGTTTSDPEGDRRLAITRYEPDEDVWIPGPTFDVEPGDQFGESWGFGPFENKLLWTGSEIVVWDGLGGGLAFDPASETWRRLPILDPPTGSLVASKATVTETGLITIVEVDHDGEPLALFAALDGESWNWLGSEVPIMGFETVSLAGAGDWVMVFSADQVPIAVHIPSSGGWLRHVDGPLAGVEAPNTVWTGQSLIIWGGISSPIGGNTDPPVRATWTPPGK